MSRFANIIAALVIGISLIISSSIAQQNPKRPSINAVGQVTASLTPDIALLRFGIVLNRIESVAIVNKTLKEKRDAILEAMQNLNVDTKDIKTDSLYINPAYEFNQNGEQIPRGYDANQSFAVKVRDLNNIENILAKVSEAGANNVGGVEFIVENRHEMLSKARSEAIEKAKVEAEIMAKALGMRLGAVTNVQFSDYGASPSPCNGYGAPCPAAFDARVMSAGSGGGNNESLGSILPGQHEFNVTASVEYQLR